MKKSKLTEQQIAFAYHQAETGPKVKEIIRRMGITQQTFYGWKRKFGGLGPSGLPKLWLLEEETRRLKKLVADLSLPRNGANMAHSKCSCQNTTYRTCRKRCLNLLSAHTRSC